MPGRDGRGTRAGARARHDDRDLAEDLACRFAGTGYSADDLFTAACEPLEAVPLAPSGYESTADPAFFAVLRDATAGMLARPWITGYLLGPAPTDAWPNGDLTRALFQALERHADDRTGAGGAALGDRLPLRQRREKRVRIRTIRVRDLFG